MPAVQHESYHSHDHQEDDETHSYQVLPGYQHGILPERFIGVHFECAGGFLDDIAGGVGRGSGYGVLAIA